MSDEVVTQQPATVADAAEQVQSEIQQALDKDPQRQLAKRVEADLAAAGVADAADGAVKDPDTNDGQQASDENFQQEKKRIADALAKRNSTFKEREAARQEAETIKSEALRMKQEAEQFHQQVQRQASEIARFGKMLRENPAEAIRLAGLDPEDFILNVAKGGTQESKLERQLREQAEELAEFKRWKQELADREEQSKKSQQQQYFDYVKKQVEAEFTSKLPKFSSVSKAVDIGLANHKSLIARGDEIADQYREATGHEASIDDILEYIDGEYKAAIGKLSGGAQVKPPIVAQPAKAQPAKPKVGSISADDASERRTLQRDYTDADSEERRTAALAAVRAVLSKAKKEE